MILFPFLFIGSGFLVVAVINHLNQSLVNYFDFVALTIVFGGTVLVGFVTLPWEYRRDIANILALLLKKEQPKYHLVIKQALSFYNSREIQGDKENSLYSKIFHQGLELLALDVPVEKIKNILGDQISMQMRRNKRVAYALKNLAKYPPAFGLIGTVFGLVNIMKKLSSSGDASFLGAEMSVALVATMYGLMLANFVVNPMGELLLKKAEEEEEYADIALNAVVLVAQDSGYLEFVEQMQALVPEHERETSYFKWNEVA